MAPEKNETAANGEKTHTLSLLVENKPAVLHRISGLFSRRGYNIESLAVGPTEDNLKLRAREMSTADTYSDHGQSAIARASGRSNRCSTFLSP